MQKIAHEPAQISYDEVIGLPLDLKLVADAIKEELSSCHEGPVSYLDKSGLKVIGTRWVHTNKGDAANPFIRARLVAQETKRVSELTPEDASSKFAATPTLESLKVMLSGGMTGMRRALAEEKVRFYDICRASTPLSYDRDRGATRRRRVYEWCAVLEKAMYGTKDAAQRFDVASQNAMTAMGYDTSKFSLCLFHSSAVDMSVFRHGDDFVVSGTRTQQKEFEEQLSNHLIVKHLATLGPCTALGDVTEVRILNMIVRWVEPFYGSGRRRIEYEAYPRKR